MITTGTGNRIARMAEALAEDGIDAFLACSPITMGYLHGFHEGGYERFLTLAINSRGDVRLICPALTETQAKRSGIKDIRPWRDGEDPLSHFQDLAEDWDLRTGIIAVDDDMQAQMLLKMQGALPAALFKPGQPTLSKLMRYKDQWELEQLRAAGAIADRAFPAVLEAIRPGVTELELERVLMEEMRRLGGDPTFCIVATGANGAEPHHLSDQTQVRDGDVIVLDFGCSVNGYQSDITRTVACGRAPERAHEVYQVVHRGFTAARDGISVGVTCGSIDERARAAIRDAGYGEFFVHRTGHGLGMRGHEEPYIVGGSDVVLGDGDCFSIEPGVYLPGQFGVRIENIVTANLSGHESFNEEPSATLIEV